MFVLALVAGCAWTPKPYARDPDLRRPTPLVARDEPAMNRPVPPPPPDGAAVLALTP